MIEKLRNLLNTAVKNTSYKSILICKYGLEFSFGLIVVALTLAILSPNFGNFVITQKFIECLVETSLGCVFISYFVAIVLEAAMIDKKRKEN